MQRRRFLVKASGALAAVGAAAVVDAPNVSAQPKVQWRMSTAFAPSLDMRLRAAQGFAKAVDEISGGRFRIEVRSGGEIMPPLDCFDATSKGTIEAFFARLARISGVPAPRLKIPRSITLARLGAGLMERAAKRFTLDLPVDRISAEMSQCFWYVDATKARDELGWVPRDPSDTLADTIRDLEQRGVVWPRS